jgi:hypothetical protein
MPVINGRYYMNPAMGAAIEEARSLLERKLPDPDDGSADDDSDRAGRTPSRRSTSSARWESAAGKSGGPRDQRGGIQRIEIEVAEIGPKHPGPKTHGYVAHVHRAVTEEPQGAVDGPDGFASGHSSSNDSSSNEFSSHDFEPGAANSETNAANNQWRPGVLPSGVIAPRSIAHVFTNTSDLVNFLRDVLESD